MTLSALYCRQEILLQIIGDTDMNLYTVNTMNPANLVKIYEILTLCCETDINKIGLANDDLLIWKKYSAQLELTFLNQQIKYYNSILNGYIK